MADSPLIIIATIAVGCLGILTVLYTIAARAAYAQSVHLLKRDVAHLQISQMKRMNLVPGLTYNVDVLEPGEAATLRAEAAELRAQAA